tara:strand:- start:173 stop:1909 length:1737 start_codon:yes stop_codon:yes gene_type:complete
MSQANKYEFSIVNLQEENRPEAAIQRNKEWVGYGLDQRSPTGYFSYINYLFKNSSLNYALITGISDRIYGEGLGTKSNEVVGLAKFKAVFNKEQQKRFILDVYEQGNGALQIVTDRAGRISSVEHLPVQTILPNKANEDGEIESYWYSSNWEEIRKQEYKPVEIEAWNPEETKAGNFIYYYRSYCPDSYYFGVPTWLGGTKWAEMDIEIANYHLSNIKSGFSGATIVQFNNGIPDPSERMQIEKLFQQKFTGTHGEKIVFMYNDSKERAADIYNAELPDADKQYEQMATQIRDNILVAHKVTSPMLLGIRQATGLGNNADEIRTANELFQNTVIKPIQNDIIDFYEPILAYMEVSSRLYYKPFLSISEAEVKKDLDLVKMEKEESPFKILNDEEAEWLNGELDKYGEDEKELLENGFEVIETEDCEGDDELKVKDGDYNLAKDWGVNADNLSKYDVKAKDGSGVWLVRYQYALSKKLKNQGEPNLIDTSRNFCIHQIDSAENGNRVFKREVLENLNNPQFGSYNVFWYKGSYNCRHVWQRKLYFKNNETGKAKKVGNVPYVVSRVNDKRATKQNKKVG